MSDTDVDAMDGDEPKKKFSGKVLILFVVLPLLLLGGIGAGVMMFMGGEEHVAEGGEHADAGPTVEPVFYELPEFLVNLTTSGNATRYLKMRVALELHTPENVPQMEAVLPRVLDGFQIYLRELRPEDFEGSTGMFRLKEELLRRINIAVAPIEVHDVLFNEVIVQ
ncbi:MAG: flagellar basal body-associated FliL family protein [Parvibaculaceae bacterium]|nr:flagellar basal body-associated FliL family protein [Parvibaculaceae bacterium]